MKGLGGVAAAAGFLCVPIIVVVVLGGGASTASATDGASQGLRPGSVPAANVSLVEQAGALCAAAPPSIIAAQIARESFDPAETIPVQGSYDCANPPQIQAWQAAVANVDVLLLPVAAPRPSGSWA